MNKVIQATYHDGSLVLDEKLDAALEGKKLTLILVEGSESSKQADQTVIDDAERKVMSLVIPDELLQMAHMSEADLKLEIAILLFQQEKITLGTAS